MKIVKLFSLIEVLIWSTLGLFVVAFDAEAKPLKALRAPAISAESDPLGFVDVTIHIDRSVRIKGTRLKLFRRQGDIVQSRRVKVTRRRLYMIEGPLVNGAYGYRAHIKDDRGRVASSAEVSVLVQADDETFFPPAPTPIPTKPPAPGRPQMPAGFQECGDQAFYGAGFERLNYYRRQAGVRTVGFDQQVYFAALAHTIAMAVSEVMSHAGFEDEIATYQLSGTSFGQNIAKFIPGVVDVQNAWYDSPPHRSAMLNPNYNRAGIACVMDIRVNPPKYWWTEDFAG